MKFAIGPDGARIAASPGAQGCCPGCANTLVARCGSIVSWHWAHTAGPDCDPWAEPDSAWHLGWQAFVPANQREVIMGVHRADVVSPDGIVVELQHSNIPEPEIAAREAHYGRMAWIFDATDAYRTGRLSIRYRGTHVTFRWKHPRKSVAACRQTLFLDLGNGKMLRIHKISMDAPCGGWGQLFDAQDIISWLNPGHVVPRVECRLYEQPRAEYTMFRDLIAQCNTCGHQATRTYEISFDRTRPKQGDIDRVLLKLRDGCEHDEGAFYVVEGS